MKKILALVLALMMILSLATTVSADTVDVSKHTFKAYQIFSGSQATDGGALGNVDWGNGVNGPALLVALKANDTLKDVFKDCEDAADVAAKLAGYEGASAVAKEFARVAYANKAGEGTEVEDGDTIAAGYYLIVDTTNVSGTDDVLNLALLEVSTSITIESKVDKPSSQKKVKDTNDSVADSTTDWQDSADYDVGDKVPFQLTATLPTDLDSYNKYYLAFHDVESEGLDFNNDVIVKLNDVAIANTLYTVETAPTDGCSFEVIISDVKQISGVKAGDVITVEYTSTLNDKAVVGAVGNKNTMHIEYSNNPNQIWNGEGKPETGETPDDTVIVFTYKVIVNKVDGKNNALTGAEFKLEKYEVATDSWKEIALVKSANGDVADAVFTATGLDDGQYKITETATPAGYNTIDPIEFTITAEGEIQSDNPALSNLSGNVTSGSAEFTANTTEGSLTTDVVNQAGATLPETGGMGTTLFYAIGGLLVAAAVVLLVTKKRMASAE